MYLFHSVLILLYCTVLHTWLLCAFIHFFYFFYFRDWIVFPSYRTSLAFQYVVAIAVAVAVAVVAASDAAIAIAIANIAAAAADVRHDLNTVYYFWFVWLFSLCFFLLGFALIDLACLCFALTMLHFFVTNNCFVNLFLILYYEHIVLSVWDGWMDGWIQTNTSIDSFNKSYVVNYPTIHSIIPIHNTHKILSIPIGNTDDN